MYRPYQPSGKVIKKMYAEQGKKYPPEFRPGIVKAARAVKTYGKNVAGGARIVGGAVKRAATKMFK